MFTLYCEAKKKIEETWGVVKLEKNRLIILNDFGVSSKWGKAKYEL